MTNKHTAAAEKAFRDADKRVATSEATQRRTAELHKTANLRAQRLEKEAAERAENPVEPKKVVRRKPANRTLSA